MRSIDDDAPSLLNEEPEFVHDEEKDDISKLQSLLKELDMSGGVARIFRQRPGQADYPYLSEMPIDTFSLENLKRIFGGGKYLVRFAAKGGRYVRSIRFSIDNCFKGEMDIVTPTTTAPAQNNDSTNTLMAFMMQQQQSQQQQQQNMMTLMMTMMTESQKSMAGVMVAAMGGKPSQEPASKFIDVMMPLLTENMKPRGGIAELAETVKLTKELMGSPQPEKEEKDDMLERLMTVGAPLIGAFMNRNQPQPTQQLRPVAPAPAAALPPTQEQVAQAKAQDLLNKLRFITPILVRAAKKNAYIDSYLDILDDSLDDEGYEMLAYALKRDDWISTLFNDNPEVIANRQWFVSLREAILNPDEDTDAAGEAPEPGTKDQEQTGLVP